MCKPGPSGHAGHSGHGGTGGHHPGGQTDLYKKPEEEGESDEEEDEDELEDDEAMTNLLPPTFPESLIFRISFNIIVKKSSFAELSKFFLKKYRPFSYASKTHKASLEFFRQHSHLIPE